MAMMAAATTDDADNTMAMATTTTESHVTFARALASPDKSTRDKTLKVLVKYLRSLPSMTDLEMLKLWKALYYCMWLSDKPPIQAELAGALSSDVFRAFQTPALAYTYVRMFYRTLLREWHMLDQHRINKFYVLMRLVLRETLYHMHLKRWHADTVGALLTILEEEVLGKTPNGPRLHVADVFLEELWRATDGGASVSTRVLLRVLAPFLRAVAAAPDAVFQDRVSKHVFAAFAERHARELGDQEAMRFPHVRTAALQATVFDLASDDKGATLEKYRRKLYALHQTFPPVTGLPFVEVDDEDEDDDTLPLPVATNGGSKKSSMTGAKEAVVMADNGKSKQQQKEKKRKPTPEDDMAAAATQAPPPVAAAAPTAKRQKVDVAPAAAAAAPPKAAAAATSPATPTASSSSSSSSSSEERPAFMASPRFDGQRPGYVFKKGAKGLGFYQDAREMKKLGTGAGAGGGAQRRHSTGSSVPSSSALPTPKKVTFGKPQVKSFDKLSSASTISSGGGGGKGRRASHG